MQNDEYEIQNLKLGFTIYPFYHPRKNGKNGKFGKNGKKGKFGKKVN